MPDVTSTVLPAALGANAAVGTSADAARADHIHPLPTTAQVKAAPASHVGATGNAHGVATPSVHGFLAKTDKAKLDGIAAGATRTPLSPDTPAPLGTAAAGSATAAARADHVHPLPTMAQVGAVTAAEVDARIEAVVGSMPAALDTLQGLAAALDADAGFAAAVTTGLAGKAPIDHTHTAAEVGALTAAETDARIEAITTARLQPVLDVASATLPGSHIGATGNAHGVATASVHGFMAKTDKAKLDGIASGATNTPLSSITPVALGSPSAGTGNTAARADHVHPPPTAAQVGAATPAEVDARIQAVIGAAPAALDTLQELAEALGDDAHFAGTVTARLAGKADAVAVDAALAGKADAVHGHLPAEIGAASVEHGHALTDVAGLQAALDSKAAADHNHDAAYAAGGHGHAAATAATAGFLAAGDKAKLDGIAAGATNTPLSSITPAALGAPAVGTGTTAARADHVHTMPTAAQVGAAAASHTHGAGDVTGLGNAATRNVGITSGTVAAGDDSRLINALQQGKHTLFWPGDTVKAAATNGCTASQETEVANQPPIAGADYDPATEQYGRLQGAVPKSADGGALDVMLTWCRTEAASTNYGVVSSVRAAYLRPGAARPNWGAWVDFAAVGLTNQNQDYATGYAAVTPAGTATDEAILVLEVRRKAADAADTLAVKARLTGCFVRYTVAAATDA